MHAYHHGGSRITKLLTTGIFKEVGFGLDNLFTEYQKAIELLTTCPLEKAYHEEIGVLLASI